MLKETTTNGIKSPGIMLSAAHLNELKALYHAGDQTVQNRVAEMLDKVNRPGVRIRNPGTENPATGGRELIYCGGYNKGKDGVTKVLACDWPVMDGIDAYTFALLGFILEDDDHYKKALAYLESWTNPDNFKGFDTAGLNAPLQHGWTIPWWANTADILRSAYSGWRAKHTTATNQFMNRLLPLVEKDSQGAPNNWLHSRIEAHMAAAIWLRDKNMLNKTVSRFKEHTPSYIYIASDGAKPVLPNTSQLSFRGAAYWGTPKFVAGMTMETCRDLGHQSLGIRSIFNNLQMAENQGIDLLAGNDIRERLTTFLEVMAAWTKSEKDHPDGICNDPIKVDPGGRTMLRDGPVSHAYPIGYSLLASPTQPLVGAKQDILSADMVIANRWVTKWEAFMYPRSVVTTPVDACIDMPTEGQTFTEGESIYVVATACDDSEAARVQSMVLGINGTEARSEKVPPYEWGHAGSPDQTETVLPVGDHQITVWLLDLSGQRTQSKAVNIKVVRP